MIPPTSIDGTDITGATIDGTDVTEITVDGDTVFTAAPPIPNSALPHDGDLLQNYVAPVNPDNASDGQAVSTLADVESNDDLTGSGTFRTSIFGSFPAYELDGVGDVFDGSVSSIFSGEYCVAGLIQMITLGNDAAGIFHIGQSGNGLALVPQNAAYVHSGVFGSGTFNQSVGVNYIFIMNYDGSNHVLEVGKTDIIGPSSSNLNNPTAQITIGEFLETGDRKNFYLGQFAVFAGAKSQSQRDDIHDAIQSNWGLP